jgi:hypothetical protein
MYALLDYPISLSWLKMGLGLLLVILHAMVCWHARHKYTQYPMGVHILPDSLLVLHQLICYVKPLPAVSLRRPKRQLLIDHAITVAAQEGAVPSCHRQRNLSFTILFYNTNARWMTYTQDIVPPALRALIERHLQH